MYKMIIVDDETEIRLGLKNYFPWDQLGFEVVHDCVNGKLALEYMKKHQIDLVLTDIRMPIMDGLDLAKNIHLQKSNMYVIFLSGYKDFYYAKEALKYGVKDYIVKPGKFEEIHEVFTIAKRHLDKEWNQLDGKKENYTENIIQTIQDYIKRNYADTRLDDISKILKLSPNYISSFYKEKTGDNISDYITKIRMEKAAELLADFHYKTYEISETIGYNNPKNFTRVFKRYYGITPREYRNAKVEFSK